MIKKTAVVGGAEMKVVTHVDELATDKRKRMQSETSAENDELEAELAIMLEDEKVLEATQKNLRLKL